MIERCAECRHPDRCTVSNDCMGWHPSEAYTPPKGSGCCHKTRLVGAPCPVGKACPHDAKPAAFKNVRISDEPMTLPADSKARKEIPIGTGVLDYFPRAMAAVAMLSKSGNDQHNPGEPLHWSKEKSTDHPDCIIRHFIDRGKIDPVSGYLHDVGLAWRALANLELVLETIDRLQ
jgi:dATP/dGTP diphosphohydrolase